MQTDTGKTSPTVGFRLSSTLFKELSRRAIETGQSVHEHARGLVINQISHDDTATLLREIDGLRTDQYRLREAIAKAIEAILLNLSDVPEAKAKAWVRDHILQPDNRKEG